MKIITLVENTSLSNEFNHKHGVCFYIETENHKILFDLGSNGLFLENAKKLGVKINEIDIVVISHGHKDHGGALEIFLENNKTAKIYLQQTAFEKHYIKMCGLYFNVGIDEKIKDNEQIILIDDGVVIDNELVLFSGVTERKCYSKANDTLFSQTQNGIEHDTFSHEQNLIISENNKFTLVSGCAHSGIVNIKNKAEDIINTNLDFVVSGFHLYNPVSRKCENNALVKDIGNCLKNQNTKYFTCHCTGKKAFNTLKHIMGDNINSLKTGSIIEI